MKEYVKSPLNYTGGKYKLLENIIPIFPKTINRFVDLFAGGFNVGINVKAKEIYGNDRISYLIEMYNYFKDTDLGVLLDKIDKLVSAYSLNQTDTDAYNRLRNDYNSNKNPLMLFILTCFSFNHQIRFNNSMNFNTPFGRDRSSYNDVIKCNLISFCNKLHTGKYYFTDCDFRDFDFNSLGREDFVYCDPPYLITNGSYNDGKRGFGDWGQAEDDDLFCILDSINQKGIGFCMSNVFVHKGVTNEKLVNWSKKYNVTYLDKSYSNCSYHFKDRSSKTIEVLVSNRSIA